MLQDSATSTPGTNSAKTVPPHAEMKQLARGWFESLRDQICAAFEAIED